MRRIRLSGSGAAAPPNNLVSPGHPSDGDLASGVSASVLGAFYFYLLEESIIRVIEQAGLALSDDPDQFRDAILALIASGSASVDYASDAEARALAARDKVINPANLAAVLNDLINGAPDNRNTLKKLSDAINAAVGMIPDNSDIDTLIRAVSPRLDRLGSAPARKLGGQAVDIALSAPAAEFSSLILVYSSIAGNVGTHYSAEVRTAEIPSVPDTHLPNRPMIGLLTRSASALLQFADPNTLRIAGGALLDIYEVRGRH